MFCAFCKEFDEERTEESRIIWENRDFLLLPTIGCLRPGYCLLMPVDHVMSFAKLSEATLSESECLIEKHRSTLKGVFGKTIIAEHGPGSYCRKGASCCDHAHLHLIPVQDQLRKVCRIYEEIGGPPTVLKSFTSIKDYADDPYLLLSPEVGVYWVWTNTDDFRSQFVRWVVARVSGIEEQYDWRKCSFTENMKNTQRLLAPRIPASIHA